ncbi:hypothetical protein BSKO_08675 [Bryopsis sp. KO-2023]|nr:hypothetical protein BSKO_08675 [Bryopsis sp. KO-2023]
MHAIPVIAAPLRSVDVSWSRRILKGGSHRTTHHVGSRHSGQSRGGCSSRIYADPPTDGERKAVETKGSLEEPPVSAVDLRRQIEEGKKKSKGQRTADSTDAVASFLTRRFGIGAGFAWLGILAVGAIGEQVKTRIEYRNEQESTKEVKDEKVVSLGSGVKYTDKKIGGGSYPQQGFLTVVDIVATADGVVFQDTRKKRRPFVFFYGARPFTAGLCYGLEEGLASMRVGGRRIITVPPSAGFGEKGTIVFPDEEDEEKQGRIPPGATLVYDLELKRVSIPP